MKRILRLSSFAIPAIAMLAIVVAPGVAQDANGGTIIWGVKTEATGMDVQTNG